MILVMLQNRWAKDQRSAEWMKASRRNWMYALGSCRSGQRLEIMCGKDCWDSNGETGWWFDNTTQEIAIGNSGGKFPPDAEYIKRTLEFVNPSAVVACGAQAEASLVKLWEGPLLAVPHPANRVLTDSIYSIARGILGGGLKSRLALRQGQGFIDTVRI